jgi:hypothetical protein
MQRVISTYLLFAIVLAMTRPASAQEETCLRQTVPLSLDVPANLSGTQDPVADIRAKVGGKPTKIISVLPDDRPHRIVILLDASGSMQTHWDLVLWMALSLADSSLPNTHVALLIFGKQVKEKVGFSEGQNAVRERLRKLRAGLRDSAKLAEGPTAIMDALVAGLELLETPNSADSLYLISDGGENSSQVRPHEATDRLIRSRIRLFVTLLSDPAGSRATAEELNGPERLADLAKKTGGRMIWPFASGFSWRQKGIAELTGVLDLLHNEMVHNYRVELELSEKLNKPRSLEMNLLGENRKQWKDVQLFYPTELAAARLDGCPSEK